ncbi:choice-of-anchor M domain-containing protein [Micromonospora sp. 067-2]|uniref:choice-of-anchor M domain-containing protein n=1 Tax=Micromonospora sp. 067-2 TaxID=2789270 RepID=UPI003978E67A
MTARGLRCRARAICAITQSALGVLIVLSTAQTPAFAEPTPGLEQSIAADQPLARGRTTLTTGHVDIGPRYVDNRWSLLLHDGTQSEPVWRDPNETLLRVSDAAMQTVPDDPAYAFLGVGAGKRVYVIPQTQNQNVVWLGWNTQDPRVMQGVDRGATLTLLGVRGPGRLTMYLQSGNFTGPQPLWRSTEEKVQSFWAEVNSHTHANWVFTEPGIYLVTLQVSADLITGEKASTTSTLRFAVGDAASADDAFAARTDVAQPSALAETRADRGGARGSSAGDGKLPLATLTGAAVLLAGGLVFLLVRGRRVKGRAERQRNSPLSEGPR